MIDRSEELVTIFGGGGFIGRYVCEQLMRSGVRIRVAQRNPRQAYSIQTLGQVGQFGFVQVDVGNMKSVRSALEGASAAINLVGVFGRAMRTAHVDGARHIAEAVTAVGAKALVHISAIGASTESESGYGRTKGEGEEAVRKAFPKATIIRPSLVFGPDDDLTNRFAAMANLPFLPVIAAKSRFQPIYVRDLAKAIVTATLEPQPFAGQTFELGGPQVMTMLELHQAILELSGQRPAIVSLPDFVGDAMSRLGWLPGAPLTRDQWTMLQRGSVPSGGHPGLEAFGIKPTPLAAVGGDWLGRFRGNRFAGRRLNLTATN
jgi:uncharacterized protein YbjT (DUF2867 family)